MGISFSSLESLFSLSGKTSLVTGGAGWLGKAISHTHAELGANVVVAGRTAETCSLWCGELEAEFPNQQFFPIALDVSNVKSIELAKREIGDRFGSIDIIVNNAWSGTSNSWSTISEVDWCSDVDMGLNSTFRVIKGFEDDLRRNRGVVINIASMYGHLSPDPSLYVGNSYTNPPSYGAAKAGMIQLTKYLAVFLAADGIRVNAISPGAFPKPQVTDPIFLSRLSAKSPIGRIGNPNDLKGIVALLSSDASSYMTGQNICVDGGWGLW